MNAGNINVVVRCRPLNARELARGATCLIRMEGNQTILTRPSELKGGKDAEDIKAFTFDKSYWSANKQDPTYADQQTVYEDLGEDLLGHAFDGYNCCIFAYGQTGSGKSYSMMGYGEDKGIIPRTCNELFNRIERNDEPNLQYRVEVSYIEIYNEKVRDLLNPKNKGNLKVREHPSLGPYVEDLSRLVVTSSHDINHLMDEGNKARTVAATNMNETSSRSHAVFTLFLTQKRTDDLTNLETEKVARISLVDLAGSERANSTGATGARLKEGANINRSLTTLGKVIAGLAEQSMQDGKKGRKKEVFVPYRDSILTWLLKDSLGGNSKTAMIAAISPADYDETLSTLRYADQAKKIKNKAVVNEDPNAKLIRELKGELDLLRSRLMEYAPEEVEQLTASSVYKNDSNQPLSPTTSKPRRPEGTDTEVNGKKMTKQDIVDQLQSSEKLLANLNETWEEKLKKTEAIHAEREKALEELGITVYKNNLGIHTPKKMPHLVNLNEDPLMSECLMYQIKTGMTRVGRGESSVQAEIRLSGHNILDDHCWFDNDKGVVNLHPGTGSLTMVNGVRVQEPKKLRSGDRIIIGHQHIFRFNNPEEVRRKRDLQKTVTEKTQSNGAMTAEDEEPLCSPTDSAVGSEVMDWNFARREAVRKQYDQETSLAGLSDEEIENLYRGITKIRNSRRTRSESRTENEDDDSSTRDSYRNSMCVAMFEDGLESVCTENTMAPSESDERFRFEKSPKEIDPRRFSEVGSSRMSRQFSQNVPIVYTEAEKRLLRRAVQRWKRLKHVSMAKTVLTEAMMLKEANIISRMFEKDVLYQFTVLEDEPFTSPLSLHDLISTLHPFDTNSTVASTTKPCIGVRVLDRKHSVVYTWPLEEMKRRLRRMRNLCNFNDRPQYRMHFNVEDSFFENPCPHYTFIGNACVAMRNLAVQKPYESRVEVMCRVTGQVKGHLRLLISPIAQSVVSEGTPFLESDSDSSEDESGVVLKAGQLLLFEVKLFELSGIMEDDFSEVHVQFKLSSFGSVSPHSTREKIYATEPACGFDDQPIQIDYTQTLSVVVTQDVLDVLSSGTVAFEVYGVAKPGVLEQYERWDDQREKPRLADLLAASRQADSDTNSDRPSYGSLERRSEEELLAAEYHDVLAWVQVTEFSPNGEYTPVQVTTHSQLDRGVFSLRQGLQRRICLTLLHSSGRQFEWTQINKISIGKIRFQDADNHVMESPAQESVPLNLLPEETEDLEYYNDGTSRLTRCGVWDSSQHNCPFLNRATEARSRILLNVCWEVQVTKCSQPVAFSMDVAVQMQARDTSIRFSLRRFLSLSKPITRCSEIFLVHLQPPMPRHLSQLWRLNTASKSVRGEEEYLGSWRPRGVSLINDYKHIQERIDRKKQVAFTQQVLALRSLPKQNSSSVEEYTKASTVLLQKTVNLWTRRFYMDEAAFSQEPPIPGLDDADESPLLLEDETKLLAEAKIVDQTDTISKRGYLYYQESAITGTWVKRWFVLRRPYMVMYSDNYERDEQGVINVTFVRIDYNRALEQMIQRTNVFAVYTSNNAYTLQAGTRSEMIDWITKIDQKFPLQGLA